MKFNLLYIFHLRTQERKNTWTFLFPNDWRLSSQVGQLLTNKFLFFSFHKNYWITFIRKVFKRDSVLTNVEFFPEVWLILLQDKFLTIRLKQDNRNREMQMQHKDKSCDAIRDPDVSLLLLSIHFITQKNHQLCWYTGNYIILCTKIRFETN